ncbi:MAG TPA: hypothetical protein VF326_12715 [Anaerolineaceae bacterium]
MNTLLYITRMLVRLTGLLQLVLGILLWLGIGRSLIPVHILSGLILVLGLWFIAIMAGRSGASVWMVVLAVVWGLIVIGLGMSQAKIMLGPAHWVIEVVHLLIGIGAIGLAEGLAMKIKTPSVPALSVK